mmetsp:Transcript_132333/g.423415  ORF Transcript_132333/g.423415 Transcript_132333/m.423415 type:complete len:377 (+) Transcript_132333:246-1376(+)
MASRWEEEISLSGDGSAADKVGHIHVRIRELPMADGVHASTGCQLWSASIVLAGELLRRPHLVEGRRVLEVGAGCGLAGIAAACLARECVITDGDEEAVRNLEHNLRVNESLFRRGTDGTSDGRCSQVSARTLRWEEAIRAPWAAEERAEVILASDVIYGHWGDTLAQAMLCMLAPGGLIVLIASEDRRSGVRSFKEVLGEAGFRVAETKLVVPLGGFRLFECRERLPGEPAEQPPVVERTEPEHSGHVAKCPVPHEVGQRPLPAEVWVAPDVRPAAAGAGVAAAPGKASEGSVWQVVGGAMNLKGIIVRNGTAGSLSTYTGRLAHGAIIEEIERTAERLRYQKIEGKGPGDGWVSFLSGRGAKLLKLVDAQEAVS